MIDNLKNNIEQSKEIIRELIVFSSHLESINNLEIGSKVLINKKEKELLEFTIKSLTNQLKLLIEAIPGLFQTIGFYKKLPGEKQKTAPAPLSKVTYKPAQTKKEVSFVVNEDAKKEFMDNLSKSRLSINMLKKKYAVERPLGGIQKSSSYAKMSNNFFRNISNQLILQGYFARLNRDLRKINSRFVIGSYVSMIFFSSLLALVIGMLLFIFLIFFKVSFLFPFFSFAELSYMRIFKLMWVIVAAPIVTGALLYIYPSSEARNLGGKIDQELPFVTIHMSAIASSGIQPLSIFKIILNGNEYKHTSIELKKLMNLINFHGEDMVTALKKISVSTSSFKLKELLNGMAVTITSGGNLHNFLSKHAEDMLFEYKLEREKYNKISETFMDIYISVAIAAPMILLMLFVIIGSTGMLGNVFGLSTNALSFLMIMLIIALNAFFLTFLRIKQPIM
jgi:pilus assembly protein TadC